MEGFIGEIRAFSGNYAPQGWHFCDGTLLSVNGYEALYSLIGNIYGGSSPNNFALPNLIGRLPVAQGTGVGLTTRVTGQTGGVETFQLDTSSIPAHTHGFMISTAGTATKIPGPTTFLASMNSPEATVLGYLPGTPSGASKITMDPTSILPTGGGLPHNNLMPCLAINYIICLVGLYPSQG
ncbi:MAG: tail fiber protein [Bacteroidales bacterium]|nr:tail fiber protein [Bacteroidales bacterium]